MGVKTLNDNTLGAYNIADLREMARRRLPKGIFEFVDRGAEDEVSLRNNRTAFERIKLMPRVLVDVSQRSQEITLFGQRQKMPIAIAPTPGNHAVRPAAENADRDRAYRGGGNHVARR